MSNKEEEKNQPLFKVVDYICVFGLIFIAIFMIFWMIYTFSGQITYHTS
jgi:hypothetical protein